MVALIISLTDELTWLILDDDGSDTYTADEAAGDDYSLNYYENEYYTK